MRIIEDANYLKDPSDIHEFFRDVGGDYLECGQGYYEDEADVIAKIGERYFSVKIVAEIESAKQDIGDRLYWVEQIESVSYTEVTKESVMTGKKEELEREVQAAEIALTKAKDNLQAYLATA